MCIRDRTIYIMIVVLLLALTGAQLTLPGVAGIILGIGMACLLYTSRCV